MKEGWDTVRLADLCSIKSGKSDTKDATPDGEYAFFDRSKSIKRSSRFLFDCEALVVPGEGTEFLPRHFVGKFDLHQRAYALFDFSPRLDVLFLYYLLHHRADYFPAVAVGATVKSLRLRHFEEFPVILPPLAEQERIVHILDKALAAIDQARANTETNLANAKTLVDNHFNEAVSEAEEGLPMSRFGEVLAVQPRNGWSPPAAEHAPTGTPVLTLSAVTGFNYNGTKVKYTRITPPEHAHCWLVPGDLLMTRSNTPRLVGHVAIYDGAPERVIYPDLIMRMRPDPALMRTDYAYWVLRTRRSRDFLTSRAGGASQTMSKIKKGDVQGLPLAIPSLAIQQRTVDRISGVVAQAGSLATNAKTKDARLSAFRASLLEDAFTGTL